MIDITILTISIATTRIIVASVIGTTILILSLVIIVIVAGFFIERQQHKVSHINAITNLDDNTYYTVTSLYSGNEFLQGNSENWYN